MVMAQEHGGHIYGFNQAILSPPEDAKLVWDPVEGLIADIRFTYCPLCGLNLTEAP